MTPQRRRSRLIKIAIVTSLALLGILFGVGFVGSVIHDARSTPVTVRNDGTTLLRLSWCADDPLDLQPGASGTIDVPPDASAVGCDLYVDDRYHGCVALSDADGRRVIAVFERLDARTGMAACERR